MDTSSKSLKKVWTDDEKRGLSNKVYNNVKSSSSIAVGPDSGKKIRKIYKETGLEEAAQEAGIIDSVGGSTVIKKEQSPQTKVMQMMSVPKSGCVTPQKVYIVSKSPATNLQILPKIIHAKAQAVPGAPQYITLPSQQVVRVTTSPHSRNLSASNVDNWDTSNNIYKRPAYSLDIEGTECKRTRKSEKGNKGLRHFSMKVCEKVQQKVMTTYNEVADELVSEFTDSNSLSANDLSYDQKNIRRRVYDALNVLMAMNIISKEKKDIRWIGLPTNSAQECQILESEIISRQEKLSQKKQHLQELLLQQIAFKNMVNRNQEAERTSGPPLPSSIIQLPFIIVNTNKKTVIDCSISNDKSEYLFNFDNTFEIHDDIEVLKRMGMAFNLENGSCSTADLNKAVSMVPDALKPYVTQLASSTPLACSSSIRPPLTSTDMRTSSPLAQPLYHNENGSNLENDFVDTLRLISRESSIASCTVGSASTIETPSEDYTDESASDRSSPVGLQ